MKEREKEEEEKKEKRCRWWVVVSWALCLCVWVASVVYISLLSLNFFNSIARVQAQTETSAHTQIDTHTHWAQSCNQWMSQWQEEKNAEKTHTHKQVRDSTTTKTTRKEQRGAFCLLLVGTKKLLPLSHTMGDLLSLSQRPIEQMRSVCLQSHWTISAIKSRSICALIVLSPVACAQWASNEQQS